MTVVGLGPGDASCLSPLASRALAAADAIVGYSAYLELVPGEFLAGKEVIGTGMTGEVARCERAIEAALSGLDVAVVSSGDAGVYGMAGLVLEMLEARNLTERLDFSVVPGIPAVMAAAALLGAPLMHDFAVISLSDLLTPWELIEKRLHAAAGADFVIALYNPRSKRRKSQLERAVSIICDHRSGDVPAGLVRRAYRPNCEVRVFPLKKLDFEAVDMLSILLVGNTQTRIVGQRMLTPRGYAGKYGLDGEDGDGRASHDATRIKVPS